jgi:hypothetical protein
MMLENNLPPLPRTRYGLLLLESCRISRSDWLPLRAIAYRDMQNVRSLKMVQLPYKTHVRLLVG